MKNSCRLLVAVLVVGTVVALGSSQASAQYPTTVTTSYESPAFVGYHVERYGLFGLRRSVRPVYAPGRTVTVTQQSVPVAAPVTYTAPVATEVAVPAPTAVMRVAYPAPLVAPVVYPTTYSLPMFAY